MPANPLASSYLRIEDKNINFEYNHPSLLEIQCNSLEFFFQRSVARRDRKSQGLHRLLDVWVNQLSSTLNAKLSYVCYFFNEHELVLSPVECKHRGQTYGVSLAIVVRYYSGKRSSFLYKRFDMGVIPLPTLKGTFIVDGVERSLITEYYRTPGFYLEKDESGSQLVGKLLFSEWPKVEVKFDLHYRIFKLSHLGQDIIGLGNILSAFYGSSLLVSLFEELARDWRPMNSLNFFNLKKLRFASNTSNASSLSFNVSNYKYFDVFKRQISHSDYRGILSLGFDSLQSSFLGLYFDDKSNMTNIPCVYSKELIYLFSLSMPESATDQNQSINYFNKLIGPLFSTSHVNFFKSLSSSSFDISETGRLVSYTNYPYTRRRMSGINSHLEEVFTGDINQYLKALFLHSAIGLGRLGGSHVISNKTFRTAGMIYKRFFSKSLLEGSLALENRSLLRKNKDSLNLFFYKVREYLHSNIRSMFCRTSISQLLDEQNVLSGLSHARRSSVLGLDGLTHDSVGISDREIHSSYYGKLCPIETPEGKGVGVVSNISYWSRVGFLGVIETPYWNIENRSVDFVPNWLEKYTFLAYSSDSPILRLHDQNLLESGPAEYIDLHNGHIFSVSTLMVPFLEHDDGNRVLMGANMQKQAASLVSPDPVLVGTGYERSLFNYFKKGSHAQLGPYNQDHLVLDCFSNKGSVPVTMGGGRNLDEISLGKNLLIGFLSMGGDSFEDSIVANTDVAYSGLFKSFHLSNYTFREFRSAQDKLMTLRRVRDFNSKKFSKGVIKIGEVVFKGEILIHANEEIYTRSVTHRPDWLRDRGDLARRRGVSIRYTGLDSAVVCDVSVFGKEIKADGSYKSVTQTKGVSPRRADNTVDLESVRSYEKLFYEYLLQLYAILGITKVNRMFKVSKRYWWFLCFIYSPFLGSVVFYMTLMLYNWVSHRRLRDMLLFRGYKWGDWYFSYTSPLQLPKYITVTLAKKSSLVVGDKLTGRHGNKGVVSKLYPRSKMPYTDCGLVTDLSLNPIGISSRMNVGQVLETHLGMASVSLGSQLRELLRRHHWDTQLLEIRNTLKLLYKNSDTKLRFISNVGSAEFESILHLICRGAIYSKGPFDSSRVENISSLYKGANLGPNNLLSLNDGATGIPLHKQANIGYMHIIKLMHQVQEKIYARSTGPSHVITGQPLGGKSNLGGQRIGEMEVWAFESYGAAYMLHELFVGKADNKYSDLYSNLNKKSFDSQVSSGRWNFEVSHTFRLLAQKLHSVCVGLHFTLF
uniref:DNA-directed RNA polymerase subunit beta n=1 Tax=Ophirina amphinema TaxID=2108040 RepID=A0A348AYQ0_9EUKA|nr:RNA polymerase subunit beta [Ophirina amphinema]